MTDSDDYPFRVKAIKAFGLCTCLDCGKMGVADGFADHDCIRYTLEDALDGLQAAEGYAAGRDLGGLAADIADCYQRLGINAPDSDWQDDIQHDFNHD